MVAICLVYVTMFLAIGVGVMIVIQAQIEHESADPELGEVPESAAIKSHRAEGWRTWC